MLFRKAVFALAALSLGSGTAKAQSDAELLIAQYGTSFIPQFIGKVVRGENVLRALGKSSYEAIPAATLQYAGMKMVGANWQLALPAQVLVQKGAEVQRRSIMNQPVFSRGLLTSWELDYLGMNFRIRKGRVLPPRVNVVSFVSIARFQPSNMRWGTTLLTGVLTGIGTEQQMNGSSGWNRDGVVILREDKNEGDGQAMSHELIHVFQEVRANAFMDLILRQDFNQKRPVSFLRVNSGLVNLRPLWIPATVQRFFGGPLPRMKLFHEWEAIHYSGSPF